MSNDEKITELNAELKTAKGKIDAAKMELYKAESHARQLLVELAWLQYPFKDGDTVYDNEKPLLFKGYKTTRHGGSVEPICYKIKKNGEPYTDPIWVCSADRLSAEPKPRFTL